jgi:hypothetical protein
MGYILGDINKIMSIFIRKIARMIENPFIIK